MRALLFSLLIMLGSVSPSFAESLQQRLDTVLEQAVAEQRIVGGVVLVAKNGKILYHRAAGWADREAKLPARQDTRFRLASMTKPIVSAAVLSLVDEGVLTLDDPVTRWIPEFTPKLADGTQPVITLRHLLTHTAGLTNNFSELKDPSFAWYGVDGGLGNSGLSMQENTSRIAGVPLKFAPASQWWYSYATDVLGDVLERATNKPLPQVLAARVFAPLKMQATSFTGDEQKNLAVAYAEGDVPSRMVDGQTVRRITYHPSRALSDKTYPSGGAGLIATAHDYFLFLEALRTGGGAILSGDAVERMLANQTGDLPIALMGAGWGWGLAAAVLRDPESAHSPAHVGTMQWGGVYGSHFWVDPQVGITAVVLTNTAMTGTVGAFPEAVRAEVYR